MTCAARLSGVTGALDIVNRDDIICCTASGTPVKSRNIIKNITVSNTPVNDVDNDKLKNHSVAMGTPVIKINKKHSERICWQEPKQRYIATIVCSTSLATGNPRKQGTKEY